MTEYLSYINLGIVWLVCGIFAYAITFAYYQREYAAIAKLTYRNDLLFAIFIGMTGPFGLLVSLFGSKFVHHGLKWR